jgi:hypothetical protein
MTEKVREITTEEFDRIFDEGKEDITPYLDWSRAYRPGRGETMPPRRDKSEPTA